MNPMTVIFVAILASASAVPPVLLGGVSLGLGGVGIGVSTELYKKFWGIVRQTLNVLVHFLFRVSDSEED